MSNEMLEQAGRVIASEVGSNGLMGNTITRLHSVQSGVLAASRSLSELGDGLFGALPTTAEGQQVSDTPSCSAAELDKLLDQLAGNIDKLHAEVDRLVGQL